MDDSLREPQKKALIIASNYIYPTERGCSSSSGKPAQLGRRNEIFGALRNPCKDARKWRDLLLKRGYSQEKIHMLIDEEADCPQSATWDSNVQLDGIHQHDPRMRPKRANIKRELSGLVRDAKPGDSLFFFFAGHVGQVTCEEHTEVDGQDEALIPADALNSCNWLKDNELKKLLVDNLPQDVQLVARCLICHTGPATLHKLLPAALERGSHPQLGDLHILSCDKI
ncbi:hypothetical protein DAEQUDRAFT_765679 [Daedalea quercina L-15889]|uniref:Peptidase C14 caspase domain-containing protein n=1 Tax=Daedalea quercina L-15889 TaxID=1314783 RepID=A0A165Q7R4_9APHY|nr:hypothetical protein DAEQUDRAFT_765679 [Daedalea quercina L-15889]